MSDGIEFARDGIEIVRDQVKIIDDVLTTLSLKGDGFYEDEAMRGLDALDVLQHELGLDLLDNR